MSENKVALVTGGSRGIGRAICVKLASKGFDIVFNYNSGEEAAEETKKLVEAAGAKAYAMKANVASSEECAALVAFATENCGKIDVLVNNAGITKDNIIMRMKDEEMDAVLDVNLKGSFYMMRECAKLMLKAKSGHIINISSVVGVMGNAGQVNYSASKAGVIGMTKSLAKELAARHITVNAVAPGMIETDMTGVLSDNAKKAILDAIPFKTMGQAEDVANAVAFFASEESSYVTGQVLCVDGGMAI